MVYVDDVNVTPNPVDTGGTITIEVTVHEEYENANRYPYRYGKKGEEE